MNVEASDQAENGLQHYVLPLGRLKQEVVLAERSLLALLAIFIRVFSLGNGRIDLLGLRRDVFFLGAVISRVLLCEC